MSETRTSLSIQIFEPDPDVLYPIDQAARLLDMSRHMILLCCRHGLAAAVENPPAEGWFFDEAGLRALRRAEALRVLCGGNLEAARLMLELQDEVDRLRHELRFWRG